MKALVCTKPGLFDYQELPPLEVKPGHAIIQIKRIGVCGTDLHAFEGNQPFFNYPRILGHELSGVLIAIDDLKNQDEFTVGESVTIIPYFNCNKCIACRNGKANCCSQIVVCGVHADGGMVEYLSVPIDSLVHGNGLGLDELALVEPLAIGAHGIRRAKVYKDEFVLVIGAGPIGLGTMEFAKIAGGQVIALDINKHRLAFCKENLRIPFIINALSDNVTEKLMEITNGDMPTLVVDATGSQKAINNAFQYLAHGGRFVMIGLQKGEIAFSHPEFHKREATLMSSRNATRADFEYVIDSLNKKLINPTNYITHRAKFDQVIENFESWLDPKNGVIKAMIEM
jgi:2-desacetyl-2-hydroxyethyl bacteriochlorophyllide A dehydrogenase